MQAAPAGLSLTLQPVLCDRGVAHEAQGQRGRGQQGKRAVLEAVGHVLVKLVQGTVGDTTVIMVRPLTLLK